MRKQLYRILLLLLLPFCAQAQFTAIPSNAIPVTFANDQSMANPWTGGLNATQISKIDLFNTGSPKDIFIFDKSGNRIICFESVWDGSAISYQYRPEASSFFPPLREWALLRDFNCNGLNDIFTYSPAGGSFRVFRNVSTPGLPPQWELETDMILSFYQFSTSQFNTNIYVSTQDIPAVVDFDGDGDLDILTFSVGGSSLEFHENFSMDNTGQCGIENFALRNRCYGQFSEAGESNTITLGDPCSFNVVNPKSGPRHIGSTILTLDFNNDGLQDIVLGDVTFANMTLLENSHGVLGKDSIINVQTDFPASMGGPAVNLDNFPAGFYEDVDGDGVKDLLVTTNSNSFSANKKSIWYYKNIGAESAPVFDFQMQNFLQEGTIDLGEHTSVAFFDFNGNGLLDMVLGSRGEFITSETHLPVLSLYLNTGTAEAPSFQEVDTDWYSIQSLGVGQFPCPAFGDLDGDGDDDMLLGDLTGRLHYFENMAGAGNQAQFVYNGFMHADGVVINIGQQSTPQIFDLDGDGLPDIIVGERLGNLNYFKNTGGSGTGQFTLITENLGGINTTDPTLFVGTSAPHFFRYEGTTLLVVGSESGKLHLYNGIDNNETGTYNLVSNAAFGVHAGSRSRPAVVDINSDGYPDIFCGSIGGGVLLYMGDAPVSLAEPEYQGRAALKLYPNPADYQLNIDLNDRCTSTARATFSIYNTLGQRVLEGLAAQSIGISSLPEGVYILEVKCPDGTLNRAKWIKKAGS